MDLTSLDFSGAAEAGAVLALRSPIDSSVLLDAEGNEMTLTLLGKDAPSYQKVISKLSNARLERAKQARKMVFASAEEVLTEEVELLANVTTAWNITLDKESPVFSVAEARKFYRRFEWARQQANAFIEDRSNFLNSSPSN